MKIVGLSLTWWVALKSRYQVIWHSSQGTKLSATMLVIPPSWAQLLRLNQMKVIPWLVLLCIPPIDNHFHWGNIYWLITCMFQHYNPSLRIPPPLWVAHLWLFRWLHELILKHLFFSSLKIKTQGLSCGQSLPWYCIHILDDLHFRNKLQFFGLGYFIPCGWSTPKVSHHCNLVVGEKASHSWKTDQMCCLDLPDIHKVTHQMIG